jgi:hypothetical protein
VERREIVPEHHVADVVGVAEAVLVLERVPLQLVEERHALVAPHALDLERAARDGVERLAPGAVMGAHQLVLHPGNLLLLRCR